MDIRKLIESLSPNEKKIIPHIKNENLIEICKKSNLDKISVSRALEYLQNKGIVKLSQKKKKIIEIGVNGALYKKKGMPERRLLHVLHNKHIVNLKEAQKLSSLSEDEFKASIGALKKKALVDIKKENLILSAKKEEIVKKSLEEIFIESLPLELDTLSPEQQYAFKSLENRKGIIQIKEEKTIEINATDLGREIMSLGVKKEDLIESITPTMLRDESLWKKKKFRRYDVISPVPKINGGKRHFVNQATDYARKIWIEMGFKEMTGDFIQSSFWNFDALFTAQDHPVREMHDTFFISDKNKKDETYDEKTVNAVKESHERGIDGSRGWAYSWNKEEAKTLVLRTHTTCLSAQTLAKLKKHNIPAKFFNVGRCFRNETVDWSHGFEFNQTEGIVVDKNANFRNLLGYLKQFFKKMGFEKVRFSPAYFPYTEPSVEINFWHPERKIWLEIGGAGMFRPEVIIPLFGEYIPVLAWGPGFDRTIMDYYGIKDLRELYKNNITQLRKIKFWMK